MRNISFSLGCYAEMIDYYYYTCLVHLDYLDCVELLR